MKRVATWMTIVSPVLFGLSFYALFIANYSPYLFVPLMLVGLIGACIGPVLFAFPLPDAKRKTVANIILASSLLLISVAIFSGYNHIDGAEQELIVGVVVFSFCYGTLSVKNKYEKWKIYTR